MVERKYLAHYIDSSFGGTTETYVRIGKDLEEFAENLNPQVEQKRNILGENSVHVFGYEPQGEVSPFYYEGEDDALSKKLMDIANERSTGDKLKTTMVDVLLAAPTGSATAPTVVWAYREDCYIIPNSVGGNNTGIQTPFAIYKAGNRVKGTFVLGTAKFTVGT